MKNRITKIFMVIIATMVLFSSCKKDAEIKNNNKDLSITNDYQLPARLKSDVTYANNMIVFNSNESFNEVVDLLERENQKYQDSYFNSKQNLNEEELNAQMEIDKFNPDAVYEAFEKYYSFQSLRDELKAEEEKWLEKDADKNTQEFNPSFYPLSDRCQCIANTDGEYMIGTTIYRVEKDGLVYEIKNADFNALATIRCKGYDANLKTKNANIIIYREEVRSLTKNVKSDCKAYLRRTGTYYYADKKRMDCILDLDWDGYGSAAKAKAKCYKKVKRWGKWKWKRNWTSMGTSFCVKARDIDCDVKTQFGEHGVKCNSQNRNWAYFVTCHVYGAGAGFRVKPGEYGGVYKKPGYNDYGLSW